MGEWRAAREDDEDAIVSMSLALYHEDPSPAQVSAAQVHATLARFRREPVRGRAVVLEIDGEPQGFALLVSFWSNELGGEICTIDEIYVAPPWRGQGHGTRLVQALPDDRTLWPARPVALELEVSPANAAALRLYARLGFAVKRNSTLRLLVSG